MILLKLSGNIISSEVSKNKILLIHSKGPGQKSVPFKNSNTSTHPPKSSPCTFPLPCKKFHPLLAFNALFVSCSAASFQSSRSEVQPLTFGKTCPTGEAENNVLLISSTW